MIVSASRVGTTARQGLQGRCHPEPCATYIIRCALPSIPRFDGSCCERILQQLPSIPRFDGSCCERILQQCAKFPRLKAQRRRLLIPTSWNGTWMLHVGTGSIQFCWWHQPPPIDAEKYWRCRGRTSTPPARISHLAMECWRYRRACNRRKPGFV